MGKENVIQVKSFDFAIEVINICKKISRVNKGYVLTRQLLKAGTSIGANVRESENAQSKKDFIIKWKLHLKKQMKQNTGWI